MMDIMLYEQVRNLYLNYLEIRSICTLNNFTYGGGGANGTGRENKGDYREIKKRD